MLKKICPIIFLFFYVCIAQEEECPKIIKRQQWSTKDATSVNYLILPIRYVVIHHTVTPECSAKVQCINRVENIRFYHMDTLGWHDIGFSFLIGGDGNIYEGCGWNREGAHAIGYNKKSVGIAFIGNFEDKRANDNMINAAHKLITCGKSQGILREDVRVVGAKQVVNTASPGIELYEQIQNWPEWVARP